MPPTPAAPARGAGLGIAFAAYVLWGFLPVLFFALRASSPAEIVAWRIVLSLAFCALIVTVTRKWPRLLAILRDRTAVITLAIAAVFILVNWSVYVYASVAGHIVEASLGYFANPIVTVLLGVFFLRERLRPMQWVAIGVSAVAVLVIAIGYGSFPWIAVALAFSFGIYGLVKKRVSGRADAVGGLVVETAVLAPFAAITLVVLAATGSLTLGTLGPLHTTLTLALGVATALPLILFAAAASRLSLTMLGFVQYLTPIMQLVVGVALLHEDMTAERWLGFGIVWVAVVILSVDMVVHGVRQRSAQSAVGQGAP